MCDSHGCLSCDSTATQIGAQAFDFPLLSQSSKATSSGSHSCVVVALCGLQICVPKCILCILMVTVVLFGTTRNVELGWYVPKQLMVEMLFLSQSFCWLCLEIMLIIVIRWGSEVTIVIHWDRVKNLPQRFGIWNSLNSRQISVPDCLLCQYLVLCSRCVNIVAHRRYLSSLMKACYVSESPED